MSIANLFQPNDYTLYADVLNIGTINVDDVVVGSVTTNVYNRVAIGDTMLIGTNATGNVNIGNTAGGIVILQSPVVNIPTASSLQVDTISSSGGATMTIGASAPAVIVNPLVTLALTPNTGAITIDQAVSGAAIDIGGTQATSVNIARVGQNTNILGPLVLSVGATNLNRYETATFTSGVTGAFVAASAMRFDLVRINDNVFVSWKWLLADQTIVPGNSCVVTTAIPASFRPSDPIHAIALANDGGAASIDVPALIHIVAVSGATEFYLTGALFSWTSGAVSVARVYDGSVSYIAV